MALLFLLGCAACHPKKDLNQKEAKFMHLIQAQDSGYFTKRKAIGFLLAAKLTDTLNSYWSQANDNDTIGKYYRNASGNYFLCTVDLSKKYAFETHLLIETKPNGEVLRKERFFHGNYSCCWENYYEGFNQYGAYFGIKTCGTGSGYCASYLYLFKQIIAQKKQNSIPESYSSYFGIAEQLTSRMELKNEDLLMHYELEKGEINDSSEFEVNETKTFDVRFVFKNNKWTTTEKNKFDGLDLDL